MEIRWREGLDRSNPNQYALGLFRGVTGLRERGRVVEERMGHDQNSDEYNQMRIHLHGLWGSNAGRQCGKKKTMMVMTETDRIDGRKER